MCIVSSCLYLCVVKWTLRFVGFAKKSNGQGSDLPPFLLGLEKTRSGLFWAFLEEKHIFGQCSDWLETHSSRSASSRAFQWSGSHVNPKLPSKVAALTVAIGNVKNWCTNSVQRYPWTAPLQEAIAKISMGDLRHYQRTCVIHERWCVMMWSGLRLVHTYSFFQ